MFNIQTSLKEDRQANCHSMIFPLFFLPLSFSPPLPQYELPFNGPTVACPSMKDWGIISITLQDEVSAFSYFVILAVMRHSISVNCELEKIIFMHCLNIANEMQFYFM